MCGDLLEYISYEFISASPAVSCMSGSSNLNSFRDRGQVAVQLVSCGVLLPGLVQDCTHGPVKPELGVIPSGQENHSGAEHLNFPGRELNAINFTEQYFLLIKKTEILLLFASF